MTTVTGFGDVPDMVSISSWWSGGDSCTVANMVHAAAIWALCVRINPRHRRSSEDQEITRARHRDLLTRFTDMATSPGPDYGRSSP